MIASFNLELSDSVMILATLALRSYHMHDDVEATLQHCLSLKQNVA